MQRRVRVSDLARLLGGKRETLVASRVYRDTAITVHAMALSTRWTGSSRPRDDEPGAEAEEDDDPGLIGLLYAQGDLRVGPVEDEAEDVDGCVLLRGGRDTTIWARSPSSGLVVWVPTSTVEELPEPSRRTVLPVSPLTVGLRSFAQALVGASVQPTVYTDYLIERLLAEMVFGVLAESSAAVAASRRASPLEQARSMMVVRRSDPTLRIDEIARQLHMSERQLQRTFAAVGSSPADELRRLRVELATELLTRPEYAALTIEEVAMHSGFGRSSSLRRAFVAYGLPAPSHHRSARRLPDDGLVHSES